MADEISLPDAPIDRTDRALLRMAKIVSAADTERLDKDPLAAGLEALAVGFSLRYPDDMQNIARQFELYDALYAWCRAAQGEPHGRSGPA